MAVVFIPALLRTYTGGQPRVTVPGATLAEVFAALERDFPGIGGRIVDSGRVRPEIAVAIDSEPAGAGLLSPVGTGSEVYLLPAIGGGS